MEYQVLLYLLLPIVSAFNECESHIICDPSKGFLASLDVFSFETCEQMCQFSHDATGPLADTPGCEFYTMWSRTGVKDDCYLLSECTSLEHAHAAGARTGVLNCQDQDKHCQGGGVIPPYNDKETIWSCDHDSWAYGDNFVYPGITCTASCPSFTGGASVSTTCGFSGSKAEWGAPSAVITASDGTSITNPVENPTIACGCGDLVVEGEVVMEDDEYGLQLTCTDPQPSYDSGSGETTFSQDSECILLCDGLLAWDLYCSQGEWSVQLKTSEDVRCYGGGGGAVTLSTWFPPEPETTTPAEAPTPTTPSFIEK